MKIFKKTLSAVLVLAILLPSVLIVSASQTSFPLSQSERLLLIDVLSEVALQKGSWGLYNVNFNELNIGAAVHTYNYVEGTFVRSHDMYPLTVDDRLVLWAIPINGQFQITRSLVSEINTFIDFNTPLALVYDASNAFAYSNQSFLILKCFDEVIESRDVLNTNVRIGVQGIDTVSLSENVCLGYEGNNQGMPRTTPANISCNVSYVTQHPYKKLCWAASVASIVNYKKGTSLDAPTVAKKYYGNTGFDQSIGEDNLTEKIKGYGLNDYQFSNYGYFDNKILSSIRADYPVGGAFDVVGGAYHATVIFGINVIAGRIQVMDPEFGRTTATLSSTGDYTYVSSYSNATLVLYAISYVAGN